MSRWGKTTEGIGCVTKAIYSREEELRDFCLRYVEDQNCRVTFNDALTYLLCEGG